MEEVERKLTDEDVKALAGELASQLERRIENRFYDHLGRGLWSVVWRAVFIGLLGFVSWKNFK